MPMTQDEFNKYVKQALAEEQEKEAPAPQVSGDVVYDAPWGSYEQYQADPMFAQQGLSKIPAPGGETAPLPYEQYKAQYQRGPESGAPAPSGGHSADQLAMWRSLYERGVRNPRLIPPEVMASFASPSKLPNAGSPDLAMANASGPSGGAPLAAEGMVGLSDPLAQAVEEAKKDAVKYAVRAAAAQQIVQQLSGPTLDRGEGRTPRQPRVPGQPQETEEDGFGSIGGDSLIGRTL